MAGTVARWSKKGVLKFPLLVLFTFCGHHRIFILGNTTIDHICTEKESIVLECMGEVKDGSSWKFNEKFIFRNKMPVANGGKDTLSLNSNYDLLISNVSVADEGRYVCIKNSRIIAEHSLRVEVRPSVHMIINNKSASDNFMLDEGTEIRSTCYAKRSRPAVNLTWLINDEHVDPPIIPLNKISIDVNNSGTFDTTTSLNFRPNFLQGTISCLVHSLGRVTFYNVSVYITVFPSVQLVINGHINDQPGNDAVSVPESEGIRCVCVTRRSWPSVNFTWMVNNDVVDHSSIQVNEIQSGSESNQTFDANSTFTLHTEAKNGTITCIVHSIDKVKEYHASFQVNDNSMKKYFYYSAPGVCIVVIVLGLFIKKIYDVWRNKKFHVDESVNEGTDESPYQFANITEANVSSPPYSKCKAGQSVHNTDNKISAKNITWLTKLSGEEQMVYWKAKLTSGASCDRSYIIARSLSDTADASEWDTFRDLACWLASLKKHSNIVKILKVEISEVPYFIYSSYVGNETLRKFLVKKYKIQSCYHNREDEESVCLMLNKFVSEIADAMLFLTTEKYRHPGLSTKKVLLDQSGRCILYDFWPAPLGLLRVRQIMQKQKPPIAWLPPETSQRLQYFDKSDVWAFGTLTWEIYSLGDSPVLRPLSEEAGYEVKQNKLLERPDLCPKRLYDLLLSTWHVSPETRPSFEEIQSALQSQNSDLAADQGDEAYEDTSSYYYQ